MIVPLLLLEADPQQGMSSVCKAECGRRGALPGCGPYKCLAWVSADHISIQLLQDAPPEVDQLLREGPMQEGLRPLDQLLLLDMPHALLKVPGFLLIPCVYMTQGWERAPAPARAPDSHTCFRCWGL